MSELKPVTFRLGTETTEKFKELAGNLGITQEKMLKDLLSTFELEQAKNILIDRSKEIEEFQSISHRIIKIYMNSLELNQSSEERIKERFQEQLIQKQDLITMLQEQLNKLKEENKSNKAILNIAINDKIELNKEVENTKNILETKETLLSEYVNKIDTLTSLVTEYKAYKDLIEEVKFELDNEKKTNEVVTYEAKELSLENESLKNKIEEFKIRINEYKDTIKEIKEENKSNIIELKNERDKMISSNEKKINELLKKHEKEINELKSINENTISSIKSSHDKEVAEIKERASEKNKMEIDKLIIKYEKILLQKESDDKPKVNKK